MGKPLPLGKWLLCSTALNLVLGCAWGIQRQQIWPLRHINHAHSHLHEREAKTWTEGVLTKNRTTPAGNNTAQPAHTKRLADFSFFP